MRYLQYSTVRLYSLYLFFFPLDPYLNALKTKNHASKLVQIARCYLHNFT